MGTTAQKLTYLNETKTLLKNKINITGANITTDTFRQYPTKLQNALLNCWNNEGEPIFTNWGTKVNGEGTNVKLDNTINARMKITPKGNTTQNGTPTPSSPINVNVVTGDNEVNIFNKNFIKSVGNLVSNTVYFNNVSSQATYQFKAGTYTFSYKDNNEATLFMKDTTGTQTYLGTNKTITFTANNDFNIYLFRSGITIEELSEVQLEKGSTATTYEPYTSQNYPLYLGVENLFNPAILSQESDYNTYDVSTGLWTTANASGYSRSILYRAVGTNHNVDPTKVIKVQPNTTYTIKFYDYTNTSGYKVAQINYCDSTGTYLSNSGDISVVNAQKGFTFTTPATASCIDIIRTDNNGYLQFSKIQLELGSKASTYNEYGASYIELNKIGTYQDYIYKDNGKWYLHKEIGKTIWNSSTGSAGGGSFDTMKTNGYLCRYNDNVSIFPTKITSDKSLVYCNRLKGTNNSLWNGANGEGISLSSSVSAVYLCISFSTIENYYGQTLTSSNYATAFNSYLANNETIIYYPLLTPTETEITNTTLINQLESLKSAMSYEGQTNISSGFMIVGASALGELE